MPGQVHSELGEYSSGRPGKASRRGGPVPVPGLGDMDSPSNTSVRLQPSCQSHTLSMERPPGEGVVGFIRT